MLMELSRDRVVTAAIAKDGPKDQRPDNGGDDEAGDDHADPELEFLFALDRRATKGPERRLVASAEDDRSREQAHCHDHRPKTTADLPRTARRIGPIGRVF